MAFDVQAARKAGYSDSEISDYLGQESKFDVGGARSAGYTDTDIVSHLSGGASAASERVIGRSHNGGVTMSVGAPEPVVGDGWSAPEHHDVSTPSVGEDAWSGFTQPIMDFGRDALDSYHRKTAEATAPLPSIGKAASSSARGLMDISRLANEGLAAAGAPLQAVVRPVAGVIGRNLRPHGTHTEWRSGIPHQYVDDKMGQEEARATIENGINLALSATRPAGVPAAAPLPSQLGRVPGRNLTEQVRAVAPQMPVTSPGGKVPMLARVSQLKADKKKLYDKVDQSGFTFAGQDVTKLADELDAQLRAKGGPEAAKASPQADSIVGRIRALATQPGGVKLSQLDEVRSDIWPLLMEAGGPDTVYGGILRKGIDAVIDGSNAPHIREARAANMRWAKADEVSRRVRSAELAAGRANSGENLGNAIRQKLSPMVDPMHGAQVQNLTPKEAAAIETIVTGDKTQNTLRTWGNRLRNPMWTGAATTPAAFLGFAGAGPAGGATAAGLTAALMQTAGQGLRGAAERRTMQNVDKLIEMIAGVKPTPKGPAVTPRGLIGGSALAAQASRQPERRRSGR